MSMKRSQNAGMRMAFGLRERSGAIQLIEEEGRSNPYFAHGSAGAANSFWMLTPGESSILQYSPSTEERVCGR